MRKRRSSRVNGTNPRAMGTNPRALGVNPRALGTNPRALGVAPSQITINAGSDFPLIRRVSRSDTEFAWVDPDSGEKRNLKIDWIENRLGEFEPDKTDLIDWVHVELERALISSANGNLYGWITERYRESYAIPAIMPEAQS